jgi:2-desacetyl-2-hydroxyethyl bacteriochlorophyllide A dehydrogenase
VRALWLGEDGACVTEDCPEPCPGEGEAIVDVRRAGVCDTDLQLARGYLGFRGVPGHEMVGTVAQDGSPLAGCRVVADINAGCGRCEECRRHGGHHCAARTVLGIRGRPGAFAQRIAVPRRCLVAVPDEVPDDQAVFAEPIAAALHVLDDLPSRREGPVVVVGDGKLGILVALCLRAEDIEVLVVGHHAEKLRLAAAAGARTCREHELAPALSGAAPVVVEATGSRQGLARALSLVRPRGTILLKTTVAAAIEIDLAPVVIHELRVVGSRCGDLSRAIELLAAGRVDPRPLIAARYPLALASEALAHAARPGVLKVLLDVD